MKLAVGTAVIWTIPSLTFHAALTGATNKLCARSRHRAHVGPIRPLGVIQAQRYWTFVSERKSFTLPSTREEHPTAQSRRALPV